MSIYSSKFEFLKWYVIRIDRIRIDNNHLPSDEVIFVRSFIIHVVYKREGEGEGEKYIFSPTPNNKVTVD